MSKNGDDDVPLKRPQQENKEQGTMVKVVLGVAVAAVLVYAAAKFMVRYTKKRL